MSFHRLLHGFLAFALITGNMVGCSKDSSQDEPEQSHPILDELYSMVQQVEQDYAKGYLLRSATPTQRTQFEQLIPELKISILRLKKDPNDSSALLQLSNAAQTFKLSLNILENDQYQLESFSNKLMETLDAVGRLQGKTLDNIDRVLFSKTFEKEDLSPLTVVTLKGGKDGWTRSYHKADSTYARVPASTSYVKGGADSWLITPRFDLTDVRDPSFALSQAINSSGYSYDQSIFVLVSEDYTGGDPQKANWTRINPGRMPTGLGYTVVDTENISLKAFEGKSLVVAFHYNTNLGLSRDPSLVWQLNSFKLMGSGNLPEPTILEGLNVAQAGGASGQTNQNTGTAASGPCKESKLALFEIQKFEESHVRELFPVFSQDPEFAPVTDSAGKTYTPSSKAGTSPAYPNIAIRMSNYINKQNVNVESILTSKEITLPTTEGLCITLTEAIYDNRKPVDLSKVEILYSTDYTGDNKTTAWKTADFGQRSFNNGSVVSNSAVPVKTYSVEIPGLQVGQKLRVALHYKGSPESGIWWGVSNLRVTVKSEGLSQTASGGTAVTPVVSTGNPVQVAFAKDVGDCERNNAAYLDIADVKNTDTLKAMFPTYLQNPAAVEAMSADGTKKLDDGGFTAWYDSKNYPNLAMRLSNFKIRDKKPISIEGLASLATASLPLTVVDNLCVSLTEVIYDGISKDKTERLPVDLKNLSVEYSTNAADENPIWIPLDFGSRKVINNTPQKGVQTDLNTYSVRLPAVAAESKIALRLVYNGVSSPNPWWGIANLRLSYLKSEGAKPLESPASIQPENPPPVVETSAQPASVETAGTNP